MIEKLLLDYEKKRKVLKTGKIKFTGVDGFDVYNISSEFTLENNKYILGRVERANSEISFVCAFKKNGNVYEKTNFVIENYQDPCITFIKGELVIGGTSIDEENGKVVSWRTSFYKGKNFALMEHFLNAPEKMKDMRLVEYKDKILVFSRPQGGIYKGGRICFKAFNNLSEINDKSIENSYLLPVFDDDEWGGVNEVHLLKNGILGVLGHIATFKNGNERHYYPFVFGFNSETMEVVKPKIIATRADFLPGKSKRADLVDVVFSGGIVRNDDGSATLYTGISDAESHYIVLDDPFREYE